MYGKLAVVLYAYDHSVNYWVSGNWGEICDVYITIHIRINHENQGTNKSKSQDKCLKVRAIDKKQLLVKYPGVENTPGEKPLHKCKQMWYSRSRGFTS